MLYRRYGFEGEERQVVTMPDGVTIDCVPMEKTVS